LKWHLGNEEVEISISLHYEKCMIRQFKHLSHYIRM